MKKITKIIGFLIILILFRGLLYRSLVNYSKIGNRENFKLEDKELIQIVNNEIREKKLTLEEIIHISNKITSEQLDFTFSKVSNNPNKVFKIKKANCIGYSSLFNSIGNYIIVNKNKSEKYEFIHLIGKLEFLGYNIHLLFDSPFLKNHDYNEIRNKETNEKIFVDPSLRDYLRIENISSKSNE